MPGAKICVTHLVRAVNGAAPFLNFARSYHKWNPGIEHELVLALKGFSKPADVKPWLATANLNCRYLYLPNEGCDLSTYRAVATTLLCEVCVFLNSFSTLQETNWLQHLVRPLLDDARVGVTGATGSYESLRASFSSIPETKHYRFLSGLRQRLYQHRHRHLWKPFPPFPNPHLRTNGFAIRRRDWLNLTPGPLNDKCGGWKLESGRASMTRQMLQQGLQVLVVDKYGRTYPPPEWCGSRTFRSGNQSQLLLADNQTRQFATANRQQQEVLTKIAWGHSTTCQELAHHATKQVRAQIDPFPCAGVQG